jgi:iron-sulfur cluster repair protein YtfE (RIC family)
MTDPKTRPNLDRTVHEHAELRARVKNLRGLLAEAVRKQAGPEKLKWAATLSEQLEALHEMLVLHFREEESAGLPDVLYESSPHIADSVATLRREHEGILAALCVVIDEIRRLARGEEGADAHVRHSVAGVIRRISRHEEMETGLIQRMYLEDLGGGD